MTWELLSGTVSLLQQKLWDYKYGCCIKNRAQIDEFFYVHMHRPHVQEISAKSVQAYMCSEKLLTDDAHKNNDNNYTKDLCQLTGLSYRWAKSCADNWEYIASRAQIQVIN